jgi:hypothetical protein
MKNFLGDEWELCYLGNAKSIVVFSPTQRRLALRFIAIPCTDLVREDVKIKLSDNGNVDVSIISN